MSKINYKSIIIPQEGFKICNVDLVSAEMLTLALVAKCPSMLDMLENGEDLHKKVACVAFDKTPDEVTYEERQASKIINYLTNYGGNSWILKESIIKSVGIEYTEAECQRIMDARFKVWPEIPQWWETVFQTLENSLTLTNLTGRIKPFFESRHIEKRGSLQRNSSLEKNARAWLNQSTVADVTKLAMIRLHQATKDDPDINFLLEIHDGLAVEFREGCQDKVVKIFKEAFNIELDAGWRKYIIPISLEIGDNYGSVKEIKI